MHLWQWARNKCEAAGLGGTAFRQLLKAAGLSRGVVPAQPVMLGASPVMCEHSYPNGEGKGIEACVCRGNDYCNSRSHMVAYSSNRNTNILDISVAMT